MKRAMTIVARITPPTIARFSQDGITWCSTDAPPGLLDRERPPAREAVLGAVPPRDPRLAHPPAEQDVAAGGAARGEVDQPVVEALHERAELVDAGDEPGDLARLVVDPPVQRGGSVRVDPA